MAGCGFSNWFSASIWEQMLGLYQFSGGKDVWQTYKGGYQANVNKMIVFKG